MTAVASVDDFRSAMAVQCLLLRLDTEIGIHGVRQAPGRWSGRPFPWPCGKASAATDAGPGLGFPVPLPVAVALNQPICRTLATSGTDQSLDFQHHQPLCGKADHLPQNVAQHLFPCCCAVPPSHRSSWSPSVGDCCGDQTLPKNHEDRPVGHKPLLNRRRGRDRPVGTACQKIS